MQRSCEKKSLWMSEGFATIQVRENLERPVKRLCIHSFFNDYVLTSCKKNLVCQGKQNSIRSDFYCKSRSSCDKEALTFKTIIFFHKLTWLAFFGELLECWVAHKWKEKTWKGDTPPPFVNTVTINFLSRSDTLLIMIINNFTFLLCVLVQSPPFPFFCHICTQWFIYAREAKRSYRYKYVYIPTRDEQF